MGKSFKNLMFSIFIILLILFPILKHSTIKPGKANIQTLKAPYENFDDPEQDNSKLTGNSRRTRPASKNESVKIIQKRRNNTVRRSLSADEKSDQPEKHPFISDEQLTSTASTTTDPNKVDASSHYSDIFYRSLEEQSPNGLKSRRSAFKNHETGQNDTTQQEKPKPPENGNHSNENSPKHKKFIDRISNKKLKSAPSINDKIDSNKELIKNKSGNRIKKLKRLNDSKSTKKQNKQNTKKQNKQSTLCPSDSQDNSQSIKKLDTNTKPKEPDNHNDPDDDASSIPTKFKDLINERSIPFNTKKKSEHKPPVKKVRSIDKLLSNNPTDAQIIAWAVRRQKKIAKHRHAGVFKPVLSTINESDEDYYEDDEDENKTLKNETKDGRFTNKDECEAFRRKVERLFDHLKRFIESDKYNEMYTSLYEDKFKNKGLLRDKVVSKDASKDKGVIQDKDVNDINMMIINLSENTLKDRILEDMENMNTQRLTELKFISFIVKCHEFHSKYMARAYKGLAAKYTRNSCNDFLDFAWQLYLKHTGGNKHRYTPEEVGPFLSTLHVMSHHINEQDQEYFRLSCQDYLSKNILENTNDQDFIEAVRSTPYYGIVHMIDTLVHIKALNGVTASFKDQDIHGTCSNSSAGVSTDVSDFEQGLYG